jgi:PmbA protein
MNRQERLDLAEWIRDLTLKQGADQASVFLSNRREIEIEFRDKKLEKLKESVRNRLSLDVYSGNRFSGHSTNDLRRDSLRGFVTEAVAATKYLSEDEYRSLADPKYYPKGKGPDIKINDPSYGKVESSDRVRLTAEIEKAAMAKSDKIISTTAWYSDTHTEFVQINSNGFLGEAEGTRFEIGAEVTVNDNNVGRPQSWAWAETRFHKDLPSTEEVANEAVERTLAKIGQDKIESGRYDMVVEGRSMRRLLRMLAEPLTAEALQQKRSFLDGMMGKQIASKLFTVIDDPFLERGLGSRHFDGDGLAAKRRTIVDKGVLKYFYIDNYYGRKLGMEPTISSPSNILFEQGTRSALDMIKSVKRGILVNGFIGGNSNSTTGDFSFGITGQLYENGELVRPVNEMNISGNALEFWASLAEMGNDPFPYSTLRAPSMLFEAVHFFGIFLGANF